MFEQNIKRLGPILEEKLDEVQKLVRGMPQLKLEPFQCNFLDWPRHTVLQICHLRNKNEGLGHEYSVWL